MNGAAAIGTGNTRRGRTLAVAGAIVALALATAAIARIAIDRTPDAATGAANLRNLAPFWVTAALSWSALTWLALILTRTERSDRPRHGVGVFVIGVAVVARIVVLATHAPSLSDDVYRYVFDGRNGRAGVNPYLVRPETRVGVAEERYPGERDLAARVNNGQMHTIYLPMGQWAFSVAVRALPADAADPDAGALVMRAAMVAAEVVMLVLLGAALRRAGRSPWWLALYAWHPLPLAEIAGSGHQDALGLMLLVGALLVHDLRPRAVAAWTVPVALAALVKPVALPAAAFMLRRRPWRAWLVSAAFGVGVTAAIAGPLLLTHDGAPLDNLRETATRFTLKWAHFGAVYEPLLAAIEAATPDWTNDPQEQLARKLCTGLLAIIAVVLWIRSRDPWRSCLHLFVAMVLLAPAAHPWYMLWALAMLPMAPGATAWVLSLTLAWGYAVLGDTVEWTVPTWVMVCAYAPVAGALAWDVGRAATRPSRTPGGGEPDRRPA